MMNFLAEIRGLFIMKLGICLLWLFCVVTPLGALDFSHGDSLFCSDDSDREQLIIGDDSPNETMVITDYFEHTGPIQIVNSGQLRVEGPTAHLFHNGNLEVRGNGQFIVDGGTYTSNQSFRYHFEIQVLHMAQMHFINANIYTNNMPNKALFASNAYVTYTDTVSDMHSTAIVQENARVEVTRSTRSLELIITGSAMADFTDSSGSILWLGFSEGESADFALPDSSGVVDWHFSSDLPGVTGVNYRLNVNNCTETLLAVVSYPGSNVTLRQSDISVIGIYFGGSYSESISGLVNQSFYTEHDFGFADRRLRLVKSSVKTWNVYAGGEVDLTLDQCILGEVITYDNAECEMNYCLVDGTGGYLGAQGYSILRFNFSTNIGELICTDYGVAICLYSSITNGRQIYTDMSHGVYFNCVSDRMPENHISSMVYYLAITDPYWQVPVDVDVPVIGSVRILKGMGQVSDFEHYSLSYGFGDEPAEWTPIVTEMTEQVMNDELAIWDTRGLASGRYSLNLTVEATYRQPLSVVKTVDIGPFSTFTPRPTATPSPTPTPATPIPPGVHVNLAMDDPILQPGDQLCLRGELANGDDTTALTDYYVALDIGGNIWFWPGWSVEPDYQRRYIAGKSIMSEVLLEFAWPDGAGTGNGKFYGALLTPGTVSIMTEIDIEPFEWGSD